MGPPSIIVGIVAGVIAWRRDRSTSGLTPPRLLLRAAQWAGDADLLRRECDGLPSSGIKTSTLPLVADVRRGSTGRPPPAHDPAGADARPGAVRRLRAHRAVGDAGDAGEDHVPTARARGREELADRLEDGPRDVMLLIMTWSRCRWASSSAAPSLVEYVLSYPRLGPRTVEVIDRRDDPVLQAIFLPLTPSVAPVDPVADPSTSSSTVG